MTKLINALNKFKHIMKSGNQQPYNNYLTHIYNIKDR